MATYVFKAMDLTGAKATGEVEADSKQVVSDQLKSRGLIVLDIKDKHKSREINLRNMRAKLVAASVRKADDSRVFSDGQVEALGKKNAAALQRVFRVAQRLSGLAEDEVDELTAALGEDPSVGSGSD